MIRSLPSSTVAGWANRGPATIVWGAKRGQAIVAGGANRGHATVVGHHDRDRTGRLVLAALLAALVSTGLAACGSSASPDPSSSGSASPVAASAEPSARASEDPAAAIGRAYVEAIAGDDLAAAVAMSDDTMAQAAPVEALSQLWSQIVAQFGEYNGIDTIETMAQAPYTIATVTGSFANATLPMLVTIDTAGKVAGFHLGQPGPPASGPAATPTPVPSPAAYVDPAAFTETEVTVGEAPWTLPGTLAMPKGTGPFPAVVLVAGSGPNDRDETVSANKPFRDIAQGLATKGLAVLRYDKRTRVYPAEMAADQGNLTVKEEVVDDALAAVDLLRRTPGVDPDRVFVVGHSLGAMLAPRIGAAAPGEVAGIAMLAGPSSSLTQLVIKQFEYLASEAGGADPAVAKDLPKIREQVALAESPSLSSSTPPSQLPLGIPAPYWLDLRRYDAVEAAANLPIPIFIAQGGRDYQVPPTELVTWRVALVGRDDVTIREYPTLNHLMIAGSGPSRPAEYNVPGHVAPEVVADLAAWILAQTE